MQVAGTITTGTITNAVAVPQEVIKKMHHFTFATRTAGTTSIGNVFSWTDAFTPLDPVNNQLHIHGVVVADGAQQDHAGYGLRFQMTPTNAIAKGYAPAYINYDFFGRGVQYSDVKAANKQTHQSYNFVIAAGEIAAGTYSIKHWLETPTSHCEHYNPNSTDDARLSQQTQSELMITEYQNI